MMESAPTLAALDKAIKVIAADPITRRLARPRPMQDEEDLWRELVACILGSAVSHDQSRDAIIRLVGSPVLRPGLPPAPLLLVDKVTALLCRPMNRAGQPLAQYRYPRARARLLVRAAGQIYASGGSLALLLQAGGNSRGARRLLVQIPGVGPKQASLFLRNVGRADDLAVLDRHILRFMALSGVVEQQSRVATLRDYETLEAQVATHAQRIGVALAVWDLAAWIVVRSCSRRVA